MSKILRPRTIMLLADEELNFEEIFCIEDMRVAEQAFSMAQFFQEAVVENDNNEIVFDINLALELVKQNPDMALINYVDQTLTQNNAAVEAMVKQVTELFNSLLDLVLNTTQKDQIRTSIENVFTNLAPQEGDAWIFWSQEEAHKCAYQYNITFAVQNKETGFFLYALPMGLTIEANMSKEKVLFITLKDESSYSVRVQAMKVVEFQETEIQKRASALLATQLFGSK